MAAQCNTLPWKQDAEAEQRNALQAEVSEANARQRDAVQFTSKQSNVNQRDVSHEAIHMQMRYKVTERNTTKCSSKRCKEPKEPEEPGELRDPGDKAP